MLVVDLKVRATDEVLQARILLHLIFSLVKNIVEHSGLQAATLRITTVGFESLSLHCKCLASSSLSISEDAAVEGFEACCDHRNSYYLENTLLCGLISTNPVEVKSPAVWLAIQCECVLIISICSHTRLSVIRGFTVVKRSHTYHDLDIICVLIDWHGVSDYVLDFDIYYRDVLHTVRFMIVY